MDYDEYCKTMADLDQQEISLRLSGQMEAADKICQIRQQIQRPEWSLEFEGRKLT